MGWQRLLVGINAKLPPGEKYTENALTLKFLSGITTPESLAYKAVQEISAPLGGARSFRKTVGGDEYRDFKTCWEWFDTNYRGMHKQGLIRDRPRGPYTGSGRPVCAYTLAPSAPVDYLGFVI